mmetsp:Transcript_21531/g.54255  ORF Transcript_21531/g.54255 Transcript_21531/m.54255 type:complete len:378 (-) Transcript_21531:764-1897(-)
MLQLVFLDQLLAVLKPLLGLFRGPQPVRQLHQLATHEEVHFVNLLQRNLPCVENAQVRDFVQPPQDLHRAQEVCLVDVEAALLPRVVQSPLYPAAEPEPLSLVRNVGRHFAEQRHEAQLRAPAHRVVPHGLGVQEFYLEREEGVQGRETLLGDPRIEVEPEPLPVAHPVQIRPRLQVFVHHAEQVGTDLVVAHALRHDFRHRPGRQHDFVRVPPVLEILRAARRGQARLRDLQANLVLQLQLAQVVEDELPQLLGGVVVGPVQSRHVLVAILETSERLLQNAFGLVHQAGIDVAVLLEQLRNLVAGVRVLENGINRAAAGEKLCLLLLEVGGPNADKQRGPDSGVGTPWRFVVYSFEAQPLFFCCRSRKGVAIPRPR